MSETIKTDNDLPDLGGRPRKFTADRVQRILECAELGMPLSLCAAAVSISQQSLINWRRNHPEFQEALEQAIARGCDARLKKIKSASDAGDWRAAAWLLEHCQPEHFAKTRIQVEAVGVLEHSFVIPQETLTQIAEARAEHERKKLESGNGSGTV
jgi:hypothetical protein